MKILKSKSAIDMNILDSIVKTSVTLLIRDGKQKEFAIRVLQKIELPYKIITVSDFNQHEYILITPEDIYYSEGTC